MSTSMFNFAGVRDLRDFIAQDWLQGSDPHPLFDVAYYLKQRPDLRAAFDGGLNPLRHFVEHGSAEGANPHPLFDTQFYLEQCEGDPEAAAAPLVHFLNKGWRMRIDPHPLFSIAYYQQRHPEVVQAEINPLLHCLTNTEAAYGDVSPWFDGRYYLMVNPDLVGCGMTPFQHFYRFGIAEGRSASLLTSHILASRTEYLRPYGVLDLARDSQLSLSWLRQSHQLSERQLRMISSEIGRYSYRPTVSLLLHVTKDAANALNDTLQSVFRQIYADWQLCVVLDLDTPDAAKTVQDLALQYSNVTFSKRGWDGDAAHALNTALDMATGEFVGLLELGDRLHARAVAALVGSLQRGETCNLVYGDEDTIDEAGLHVDPLYKPDWSPEYLLAYDYPKGLGLYRTALLRSIGGFRLQMGGGASYDLALRISRSLTPKSVRHVQKVVYHKRPRRKSGRGHQLRQDGLHNALTAHLAQDGSLGQVVRGQMPDFHHVVLYNRLEPLISIVIPTANASFAGPLGREWVLTNCIRSIVEKTSYRNVEIIIVHDGNLRREQVAECRQHSVRLIQYDQTVFNFSRKINLGVASSSGEYVLLLNDDVEAKQQDWLNIMLGYAERSGVGVVGAKLFFPDGRLQHTGIIMQEGDPGHLYYRADGNDPGLFEMNNVARNCLAVTGACQLVRRTLFDDVGGYDEKLPLNFNDVDFCLRVVDAGYRIVFAAAAELYHFEGISKEIEIGSRLTTPAETNQFQATWRERYFTDPFYHPELPSYMPLGWTAGATSRPTPPQARRIAGDTQAAQQGVNFLGPVNRSSGMGTAARSYVAALQGAGSLVRIVNMDKIYHHQTVTESGLSSVSQEFPISLVQANADATPAVLGHYAEDLARAAYRIGLWVWELPAARIGTFEAIRNYDEIWVPTRFCQAAYQPLTKSPVTIVPYALRDLPLLQPDDAAKMRDSLGIPRDNFVFLYMFDTYSLVERKNPNCLLDAFEAEFRGRSDITLVLKVSYFDNLKSRKFKASFGFLTRLQQCMDRCSNIKLITTILPQHDLYRLINAADCYVSPHRSEGFGLTVAESMFYRKTVIATDFSGTTDLVLDDTGLKLAYTLVELSEDVGPYGRGNIWADPSVMHLRELMQTVLSDADLRARLGNAGHAHVMRHFSPEHIGRVAHTRLLTIAAGL